MNCKGGFKSRCLFCKESNSNDDAADFSTDPDIGLLMSGKQSVCIPIDFFCEFRLQLNAIMYSFLVC